MGGADLTAAAVQAAILATSATGIWLVSGNNHRRLGGIIGLLGAPFWLFTSWQNGQWGIFALSLVFAVSYARAALARDWVPYRPADGGKVTMEPTRLPPTQMTPHDIGFRYGKPQARIDPKVHADLEHLSELPKALAERVWVDGKALHLDAVTEFSRAQLIAAQALSR